MYVSQRARCLRSAAAIATDITRDQKYLPPGLDLVIPCRIIQFFFITRKMPNDV